MKIDRRNRKLAHGAPSKKMVSAADGSRYHNGCRWLTGAWRVDEYTHAKEIRRDDAKPPLLDTLLQ